MNVRIQQEQRLDVYEWEPHTILEEDVRKFLQEQGFMTTEVTYHAAMPDQISKRLARIFTPTSLYIRSRADRIAVHTELPIVVEWEAKTHAPNIKYHDMTLEMIPIAHHLQRVAMKVECLYVYKDSDKKIECGFWTHSIPPIRQILIPERWTNQERVLEYFRTIANDWFPDVPIREGIFSRGSGDPFLIIDESALYSLPHWKGLITNKLDEMQ